MSYGLQILNSAGGLTYDSSSVTWNQVDFFEVAANSAVSKTYPFCIGREILVTQHFINPPPADRKMLAHIISVNNGTVSISGGSEQAHVLVLMR